METVATHGAWTQETDLAGVVIPGLRLGRLLGAPTANVSVPCCDPALYGSWAAVAVVRATLHEAIAHVGTRPSVGESEPLLEVHLLDFDGDLYGEHLRVRLLHKVSGEVRLDSLECLRRKIADDIRRVRLHFARLREATRHGRGRRRGPPSRRP